MTIKKTFFLLYVLFLGSCGPRSGVHPSEKVREKTRQHVLDTFQVRMKVGQYEHGFRIFGRHCQACHFPPHKHAWDAMTFDHIFTAMPAPFKTYFSNFIIDGKSLRESGDPYAIKLHQSWGYPYDHFFRDTLNADDIEDLLVYIQVGIKQRRTD